MRTPEGPKGGGTASEQDTIELRVHGIGSHKPLDALGAPVVVEHAADGTPTPRVAVYEPPEVPRHRLRFLNWSRVTRSSFGAWWWFLFPLTVANAAGYMAPVGERDTEPWAKQPSLWHRAYVGFWSLVLTLGYLLWSLALVESVPRRVPDEVLLVLEFGVVALMVVVISRRIWARQAQPAGPRGTVVRARKIWWCVQLAVIVGAAIAVFVVRPSAEPVESDVRNYATAETWMSSCWSAFSRNVDLPPGSPPEPDRCVNRVDVLSTYVVATTVLSVVAVVLVIVASLFAKHRRRRRSSLRAAITISAAVVMLNTVFGALRTGLSWLSTYLAQIPGMRVTCDPSGPDSCVALIDGRRFVLPYQEGRHWPIYDLVPVALLWTAALALAVVFGRHLIKIVWTHLQDRDAHKVGAQLKRAAAERTHAFINDLPWRARWPVVGVVALLAVFAVASVWIATFRADNSWARWLVLIPVHLAALLIPLVVIATMAFRPVRVVVSTVADVIGYWPRQAIALSGTSYTNEVCDVLTRQIERADAPLVLAGHSQGSVLCYTALERWVTPDRPSPDAPPVPIPPAVSLLTCGSPLKSLYEGFFPRYFRRSDFDALRTALDGRWFNCWRLTDPIASPFLVKGDRKVEPTLDADGKLNKHSNYWTEKVQRDAVEELIAESRSALAAQEVVGLG